VYACRVSPGDKFEVLIIKISYFLSKFAFIKEKLIFNFKLNIKNVQDKR